MIVYLFPFWFVRFQEQCQHVALDDCVYIRPSAVNILDNLG